jgi:antitoxin component of MazEF toxin-antitoxin module
MYVIINVNIGILMEKKFVKVGSTSYGIIIPPSILSVLGIDPQKDKVKLSIENGQLVITQVKNKKP